MATLEVKEGKNGEQLLILNDDDLRELGLAVGDYIEYSIKDKRISFTKLEREITEEDKNNEMIQKIINIEE